MTVVAAVARDGAVLMAADRQTNYATQAVYGARKIYRLGARREVLLAAAGNGALPGMLARHLQVDEVPAARDTDVDELLDWAGAVACAATDIAAGATPALLHDDGGHRSLDGALLLGYAGHLFYLFTNQAQWVPDGVASLGVGSEVALGAMHTALRAGQTPEQAAVGAVELACRFCPGCGLGPGGRPWVSGLPPAPAVSLYP